MSDIKCPFCQQELETNDLDVQLLGCENQTCKHSIHYDTVGTKELWQELIRTRKALDVAVDALKEYEDRDSYDCNGDWCGCEYSTAHKALEQITALEQKDVK